MMGPSVEPIVECGAHLELCGLGVEGAGGGLQVLYGPRQLHLGLPQRLLHLAVVLARLGTQTR